MSTSTQYTIDEIKELLCPVFAEVPIAKAILFGSYARGDATEKSDIDLFIDSGGRLQSWDFYHFCDRLEERACKRVEGIEKIDLNIDSQLYRTIETEGVTIYETK
ncbi:MAG: nucleotidyltransferase family protein [Thermoguttaceae bacterium]